MLAEVKQLHLTLLFAQAQLSDQPLIRQQLLALAARLDNFIESQNQ